MAEFDLQPPEILYAILVISGGVVLLGYGIRFFRLVVGLSGFAACSVIAFIILANIHDAYNLGSHSNLIMLAGSLISGIVGAALGLWIWMVALGAVGGLGGFSLAMWSLSWPWVRDNHWLKGPVERPLFIAGATASGGVLALLYEKAIVVTATALSGSLAICSGLDVIVQSGLNNQLRAVIVNRGLPNDIAPKTMAMLISVGCLFIIGIFFQYRVSGREKSRRKWSIDE